MTAIVSAILSFLLLYKYVALFVIAFLAALILPLPSSTTLAAAGAFASQGYFNILAVLIVAFIANVAGDMAGFWLARTYGEEALAQMGFARILRSHGYHKFKEYINEAPQSLIYFTRFLTQLGPAVNILAGLARVPVRTFVTFDLLGEASYVLAYGLAGYFLGSQWEYNTDFLAKFAFVLLSLGAIVILIQFGLYRRQKRRRAARGD